MKTIKTIYGDLKVTKKRLNKREKEYLEQLKAGLWKTNREIDFEYDPNDPLVVTGD